MPRVVVFGGSGKAGEYISCELVRSCYLNCLNASRLLVPLVCS